MGIDAKSPVMLNEVEGAPNRLEDEHEEIFVIFVIVYEINDDIAFRVCKGAVNPVIALIKISWVKGTKLGFVFLGTVKLFHSIMAFPALVAVGAVFAVLT